MNNWKWKDENNNTFWSAVMGAAVGATAVMLADKKNRDMLKRRINSFLESAEDMKEVSKEKINDEINKTKKRIHKATE